MSKEEDYSHKKACHFCKNYENIQLLPVCNDCSNRSSDPTLDNLNYSYESYQNIVSSTSIEEMSHAINHTYEDTDFIKKWQKINQIENYYHSVNEWIDMMDKLNQPLDLNEEIEDKNEANFCIRCATYCSFGLNFMLLIAKALAMSTSASYTIMSSLADSCLDIIAGIIISCTAANSKTTEEDKLVYPVGKSRISTVGILVFSVLMSCCAIFIILQCVHSLLEKERAPPTTNTALFVMVMTICVKFCMWIVYNWLGHPITMTLAEDHRNDVFTNSFGLFMYWGGDHFYWWMDSAGGLIIALFVLNSWAQNAIENAKMLIGMIAPSDIIRNLTYVAAHHHPLIKGVSKVMSYQIGPNYFAEVHIIVSNKTKCEAAFWIADSLQKRLERVDGIEHAFVHLESEKHDEKLESALQEFNVIQENKYEFNKMSHLTDL